LIAFCFLEQRLGISSTREVAKGKLDGQPNGASMQGNLETVETGGMRLTKGSETGIRLFNFLRQSPAGRAWSLALDEYKKEHSAGNWRYIGRYPKVKIEIPRDYPEGFRPFDVFM
jgi:hypothetical protein